ncbi:T9SS type A sorting domain-containing protein, partial [bacterium]|nr:T9SS type A sorting domain-containing protein [bacterium]
GNTIQKIVIDNKGNKWIMDGGISVYREGGVILNIKNQSTSYLPSSFKLYQNYPNPFNAFTTINFQIPKSSKVTIKIYDILGREVRTLVDYFYSAGNHSTTWDGLDNLGHKVSSGVYFYCMESIDFKEVKKALLLK